MTLKGKHKTKFVKKHELAQLRQQIKSYAAFRRLVDAWVEAAFELSELRRRSTPE